MRIDGIQLREGSNVSNLTIASGTAFPANPNTAELFYRTDEDLRFVGLYVFINSSWQRIASSEATTVPSAATFPAQANVGDLFYKNSDDSEEALYVYTGSSWIPSAATAYTAGNGLSLVGSDIRVGTASTAREPAVEDVVR